MSNFHAGPINQNERIESMDVLRGIAVLGILVINIKTFAMPIVTYENPTAYGDITGVNYAVWLIGHVFVYMKMMNIFSMLFGAGIVMVAARYEASGKSAVALHYRRTLILLIFGLLHIGFFWFGDILFRYAVCALIVYWFRNARPTVLLILGTLIFSLTPLYAYYHGCQIASLSLEGQREFLSGWLPPQRDLLGELAIFRGGWYDQTFVRMWISYIVQIRHFLFECQIFRPMGLMIVGMALYKWDVFSARRSATFYWKLIGVGALIGLPVILFGVYRIEANEWSGIYYFHYGLQFNLWAAPLVSLGMIGAVMLVCRMNAVPWLRRPLAATGRMALSCYLMQTVLCCVVFYGYGFGWIGHVERRGQISIEFGIWLVLLIFSSLWLRMFRFGPMEWLWRSLTYLSFQPLRR